MAELTRADLREELKGLATKADIRTLEASLKEFFRSEEFGGLALQVAGRSAQRLEDRVRKLEEQVFA